MKNSMRPIHPGEVLREEFLAPFDLSANRLAQAIGVPTNRVTELVAERRSMTADTALRLAVVFNTSPEFWMNLQQAYELRSTAKDLAKDLKSIKPFKKAVKVA
jgi:addiction module HigA family antidote